MDDEQRMVLRQAAVCLETFQQTADSRQLAKAVELLEQLIEVEAVTKADIVRTALKSIYAAGVKYGMGLPSDGGE